MKHIRRIFTIVLDSFGIGAAPDAHRFGDTGAHTLRSVASHPSFSAPTLASLGLFNIEGAEAGSAVAAPIGIYGRMSEASMGKDTTMGHWELAGVVSTKPLPTYPDGFPDEILSALKHATGRDILCNKPYSGTDVIRDYGKEHVQTGALIVYTSADSVLQIAAHEAVVPVDTLYDYCQQARSIMTGKHSVGRIIARPFEGDPPYQRTPRRHDFSMEAPGETMLDAIKAAGMETIGVGKISDIFAGRGLTDSLGVNENDADGMRKTSALLHRDFTGLAFVNLVDFDMKYGHRRDIEGYAKGITAFDHWLADFIKEMRTDDLICITADHGCDPGYRGTDHTREYVPLLLYAKGIHPKALGTRSSFSDLAATITHLLSVPYSGAGQSFAEEIV